MKLHQLIAATALSVAALPFAAQAEGDPRSKEWLQSVHSTKARAEVVAAIGNLPLFAEGDPPQLRFATPTRSRDEVRSELADRGPIEVGA